MEKRIYEHKRDLHHHRTSNSLVIHAEKSGHLPDWKGASVLHAGLGKRMRKTVENAYIKTMERVTNHREGCVTLAEPTGRLVLAAIERKRGNQSPSSIPRRPAR